MGLGTAPATYIALDDPSYKGKFNGVTHMMMDGTDAIEVMDVILDWANKNIPNPPSTGQVQFTAFAGHMNSVI